MKNSDIDLVCSALHESPIIKEFLQRWDEIDLPDAWLCAGAITQTVWNSLYNFNPSYGISDADIIYFDNKNLYEIEEETQSKRISRIFEDVNIPLDVKNEARVHLWYESKFGKKIKPYLSSKDAIASFPCTATAVGVRKVDKEIEIYAPYGLTDLLQGIVRPNYRLVPKAVFETKSTKWKQKWPNLEIVTWDDRQNPA